MAPSILDPMYAGKEPVHFQKYIEYMSGYILISLIFCGAIWSIDSIENAMVQQPLMGPPKLAKPERTLFPFYSR